MCIHHIRIHDTDINVDVQCLAGGNKVFQTPLTFFSGIVSRSERLQYNLIDESF